MSFRSPTAEQWSENSPLPPHFLPHAALHFSPLCVFARLVYHTCISKDFIAENFMTTGNEVLFTGRELKGFFSWLLYSCNLACKSEPPEGKQAVCSNSGGLSAAGSVGAARCAVLILANYILTFPLSSNPPHGCLESITSMSGCGGVILRPAVALQSKTPPPLLNPNAAHGRLSVFMRT